MSCRVLISIAQVHIRADISPRPPGSLNRTADHPLYLGSLSEGASSTTSQEQLGCNVVCGPKWGLLNRTSLVRRPWARRQQRCTALTCC